MWWSIVIYSPLSPYPPGYEPGFFLDSTTVPDWAANIFDPYPQPAISVPSCNVPHLYPNGDEIDEHDAGQPHSPFVGTAAP